MMKAKEDCRLIFDFSIHQINVFDEFGFYNYSNVQSVLPEHIHPDMIEICYLVKGRQAYFVGEDIFEVQGGEVFVTFPNESHGTGNTPEEKGVLYWLVIKRPQPGCEYLGLGYMEANEVFGRLSHLPTRLFKGGARCEYLLQEIKRKYFCKQSLLNRIALNNLLVEFLLQVIECSENSSGRVLNQCISDVLRYIDGNLSEVFSLEDLADRCNLSVSRFKHLFKAEVGVPPGEYINRKRVEKAEWLLQNSNLSIRNIAYDLGFSSPGYFATVFKQYKGYSPTALLAKDVNR